MRKCAVHEAVYRCGSGRMRLLLLSAPERVPEGDVEKLTLQRLGFGGAVYTVGFESGGVAHTHFYPLGEILRVEETEIGVDNRRGGDWVGQHEAGGCEYREGLNSVVVRTATAVPDPEVNGTVTNLRTFEQFGKRMLVVAFEAGGLRRFHKFPVAEIVSVLLRGVKHTYPD